MTGGTRAQRLGWLFAGVTLAAVAAGLVVIGPPADERARRLDERRTEHLIGISSAIERYWGRHGRLPASLDELATDQPWIGSEAVDPATGEWYEYRRLEPPRYQLCAQFERESRADRNRPGDGPWAHVAGRQCFTRAARRAP